MPFPYHGASHLILLMAKSNSGVVTVPHLRYMNPTKFKRPNLIRRSIHVLVKHGLMEQISSDEWRITKQGVNFLRAVARPAPGYLNNV